jgi:membrane protein implicated in regulation of membrane protease activity
VSEKIGFGREQIPGGALAWTNWVAGVVAVYSTLFGIGKLVFGEWGAGFILLVIATIAFAWIARSFRSEPEPPSAALAAEDRIAAD